MASDKSEDSEDSLADEEEDAEDEAPVAKPKRGPDSEGPYRESKIATRKPRVERSFAQRALPRWVVVTAVLTFFFVIYTRHPYYQRAMFEPWRPVFAMIFAIWATCGLPYTIATLKKFAGPRYWMTDGPLHLLLLVRAYQKKKFWRIAKNRRVRTTLLAIIVKAFYLPLMTSFLSGHTNTIANMWLSKHKLPGLKFKPEGSLIHVLGLWWNDVASRLPQMLPSGSDISALFSPGSWTKADMWWGLDLAYNVIFFVDCGWALIGYGAESRWLGNKTKSVEPTALGWAVAISCYPPFNEVLGTYLPLAGGGWLIKDESWRLVIKLMTIILFAIYASATVAFGFKFSNLTNRGIVSRGPYKYIRHPAYACKCTSWWLENLPTLTLQSAFFLACTCGVYAMRAWTEERHLSKDPAYRAYKKKVRWAAIPGIF